VSSDWSRSVHPDWADEEAAETAQEAQQPSAPPARGRGRARTQAPAEPTPVAPDSEPAPAVDDGEPQAATEPPEWLAAAREAFDRDPSEAFKVLAKNLPRDQLERDEVISGLIGHKADAILKRREQEAAERAKLEAAQNNDLYTLGEISQRELQGQLNAQQQQAAMGPFMDAVVLFQQQQPEELQRKVAGKSFGEGKGPVAGFAEYLQFMHDEAVKLALTKRESALRKSVMSEVNGDEPVPERESGTPGRVRDVTDEQIAAMDMAEYNALFDENGRPKPGVRHRATRSIPLTQH
jgi:hypothetical protein